MYEKVLKLDDGICRIHISYEDGYLLSIDKKDFNDHPVIETVISKSALESALNESIKNWNDAKKRYDYTGDLRDVEHVIYFAARRDTIQWILNHSGAKLCDDISKELNVLAIIRLMELDGKQVTFECLHEYFEKDVDKNTLNKILEKNYDLGIIDRSWQRINDRWNRTFNISSEASELINSLIEKKNLKLVI
ncbi:MAG: hypothetical protein WC175_03375 [Candidatus Dojkabacteria bacterium]